MSQASDRQDIYLVLRDELYKDLQLRTVLTVSQFVLFIFLATPAALGVPSPGTEPLPQQQPKPW